MNLEASPELEYWSTGVMDTQCALFKPSGLRLGERNLAFIMTLFYYPLLRYSLAQTWFSKAVACFADVAPLAQTWITGLVAYNKPKRQGGQGESILHHSRWKTERWSR